MTATVEETKTAEESGTAVKLDFRTPGYLESLRFVPDDLIQGNVTADDVEIAVKAAGVNFRHVLYALGKFSAIATSTVNQTKESLVDNLRNIAPVVDKVFPWTEARAAFAAMQAGEHFGKIVLDFG